MSFDIEELYNLLPAYCRFRDAKQDEPLKALLTVVAEQIAVIEENLAQLYDDQFIETCAEWVVPYIGDLIGYQALHGVTPKISSPRAEVANTIGYRRRKGTAAMLEQLARDITGWDAHVVEFFKLLATTQYMNHIRPGNLTILDLRHLEQLERLNTPFDSTSHTVEVRRIPKRRGKYNIPNIGIFLWRLHAYPLTDSTAFRLDDRRYLFNPLGMDMQLFNKPLTEEEITHISEPVNLPVPISRGMLERNFETYYGKDKSILLKVDEQVIQNVETSPPETSSPSDNLSDLITVCNLSDITDAGGNVIGWANMPADRIAIDPVLGRIAFPANQLLPEKVHVTYHYGFSAEMGGGEYARPGLPEATANLTPGGKTLLEAIAEMESGEYVIQIDYSGKINGDLTIKLRSGQKLTIQAKSGKRPVIFGSIKIESAENAEVAIDGILITGGVEVSGTKRIKLTFRHCTLVPWIEKDNGNPRLPFMPSIKWIESKSTGTVVLDRTISGRLIPGEDVYVEISDSIVDALQEGNVALAASDDGDSPAGTIKIVRCTIIGTVRVREIELAENSIFTGHVTSERRQQGCVRFSYLPMDSNVPRRYYCQPTLAIKQAIDKLGQQKPDLSSSDLDNIAKEVSTWLKPSFTSRYYNHSEYMQLHSSCPVEIRTGADDEAEMGAFHSLYQPQREANLRTRLDEYLRFGLEAGIFYAT